MSYFDDNEDSIIYGLSPGLRREARDDLTCRKCGAFPLKLRFNDNGNWQLCEQERGDRNQNVWHQCHKPTYDDFEALE